MCGLVGFLKPDGFREMAGEELVRSLSGCLSHRGPDDAGSWVDGTAGIAFGHRRLSILDISKAGHQPMISASGRYVIALNGEVYNHLEIRRELEVSGRSVGWRGRSDTESVLAAFDGWGIDGALQRMVGMFAFALWDRVDRVLTLARDRIGEKPLYYGWQGAYLLFGSELKALRHHPAFHAPIDRHSVASYLRHGYIRAPASIYEEIFKLVPGTYMQVSTRHSPGELPRHKVYWSVEDVAEKGAAAPFTGSEIEAVDQLEVRLKKAVALQSVADVPVGAFLSGGIDSTVIVALMQAQSARPIKTFTVGFRESEYNEAAHGKAIAEWLGTDHTQLDVTPRETMAVIPELPVLYDEPFGDSSAIATHLVAQLARQRVAVSLSGDGGDELFGGYERYRRTCNIWRVMRFLPVTARRALGSALRSLPDRGETSPLAWKAGRVASYLAAGGADELYNLQISQQQGVRELVLGLPIENYVPENASSIRAGSFFQHMMLKDTLTYLPDDILVKVDRAAMGVSLETRVPMLDREVVEFAWRLPVHMKVGQGETKRVLKNVLRKYVPSRLVDRPKMGFGVPVGQWIRGPLRDWAENLLAEDRLRREGYLEPRLIRKQWNQHMSETSRGGDRLWTILMFQAWLSSTTDP